MKDIRDRIKENLSYEHVVLFNKILINCLYDRDWCGNHGINYVKPDYSRAKEILYKEEFENKTPEEIEKSHSGYINHKQYNISFFEALRNLVSKV